MLIFTSGSVGEREREVSNLVDFLVELVDYAILWSNRNCKAISGLNGESLLSARLACWDSLLEYYYNLVPPSQERHNHEQQ